MISRGYILLHFEMNCRLFWSCHNLPLRLFLLDESVTVLDDVPGLYMSVPSIGIIRMKLIKIGRIKETNISGL